MDQNDFIPNKIGPYFLTETIGKGTYATVKVAHDSYSGSDYACKVIRKKRLIDRTEWRRFQNEIRTWQQLRHANLVQLIDLYKDTINFYSMMEYCPNSDLFKAISKAGKLSEETASVFFRQLLEAVDYLHSNNIGHRDLKPENIFLFKDNVIKVGDFGFAIKKASDRATSAEACGSLIYTAPEVISGHEYDPIPVDMWSCGVILYTMLSGAIPWVKRKTELIIEQIKTADFHLSIYMPVDAGDLIKKLLVLDPTKRLTAKEALQHPFITKFQKVEMPTVLPEKVSMSKLDDFFEVKPNDEIRAQRSLDNIRAISSILPSADPLSRRKKIRRNTDAHESTFVDNDEDLESILVPETSRPCLNEPLWANGNQFRRIRRIDRKRRTASVQRTCSSPICQAGAAIIQPKLPCQPSSIRV